MNHGDGKKRIEAGGETFPPDDQSTGFPLDPSKRPLRFEAIELPVIEKAFSAAIAEFHDLGFANLSAVDVPLQSLAQPFDWLIAPLKQQLKTRVVDVIPHGALHYLPFAALADGQYFLGDKHTLFYLPSASVLPFIQQKRSHDFRLTPEQV